MPFKKILRSQTVIALGGLPNEEIKAIICEFILRKFRFYLEKVGKLRNARLFVVIDETYRLKYDKESSAGPLLKKTRKYGVGVILATQDPVDFTNVVYNNIGRIILLQLTLFTHQLFFSVSGMTEVREET